MAIYLGFPWADLPVASLIFSVCCAEVQPKRDANETPLPEISQARREDDPAVQDMLGLFSSSF
jgi:hypothetical protein